MSPSHDPTTPLRKQARRRRHEPRRRRCLLKGCAQWFAPAHPQARYCRDACREAAARWRRWKARQRWRQTESGRACRRAQSGRRRARWRRRRRPNGPAVPAERGSSSSDKNALAPEGWHSCDRPGCYDGFVPTRRSPLQRFCSPACWRALACVVERERRWHRHCRAHERRVRHHVRRW